MAKRFYLPLAAIESDANIFLIENTIKNIKGVDFVKLEYNNKRIALETNSPNEIIPKALNAIHKLGYEINRIKQNYPVTDLSCASCAVNIENKLKNEPGILHVAVNYANNSAAIEYIPEIINGVEIKNAVQAIGYDIIIDESDSLHETLEKEQLLQKKELKNKSIYAILFSIPLVVIGMFFMNMPYANYIMWLLASPVLFVLGKQFFINAWKQAKHKTANMDTLVAVSTSIAYAYSIFNTVYPEYMHSKGLHPHVYFEASAVVISFILLGRMLEENAKSNTASAIKKLIGLQPKTVTIIQKDGNSIEVPISSVNIGDIILVKPGEKIAVDGKLIEGSSYVDESMINGEPIASLKQVNDFVFSGTLNQKGSFKFIAEKVGSSTLLSQIIAAVKDAQGSKAPVQKLVDKIASIFVPIVIGIAVISFCLWLLFGGVNGFSHGLLAMVTVLVIACPCALGLATPTAIMVGMGKGAENGILIKDAESLELAYKTDCIVLDKTGTVTEGKPEVSGILFTTETVIDRQLLFSILYSLESLSEHPLANAICNFLAINNREKIPIELFNSITGGGVTCRYNGIEYFAGSLKFIESKNCNISNQLTEQADKWLSESNTVIWFADVLNALCVLAISDKIKANSTIAIKQLLSLGIKPYMLTGDNLQTAKNIAGKVGIKDFKAECTPTEKAAFIKNLQEKGHIVAMAGDGINDSMALAQADISIAMSRGSDIAMDVAKITLISSDLLKITEAIQLSRNTVKIIRQNLFWAFIYNLIGIPIAAGLLYPINGFLLNPMFAGAAMALSSVSVVSNSLRLKYMKLH